MPRVRYIVSAIIYLSAMSSVDEDLIPDGLSPIGTIAAYVYIIASRLKDSQSQRLCVACKARSYMNCSFIIFLGGL